MSETGPCVLMVGTSLDSPGGMTAVVSSYRESGFFVAQNVRYLSSYEGPGALRQLRVFGWALLSVLGQLLRGRIGLLHAHSASRGSFWRKSMLCALARAFGVPYVFHVHSGEFALFYRQECGPWAKAWLRHTLRRADTVLALTPGWIPVLQAMAPDARLALALNPVAVPVERALRSAPVRRFLFLGRLREKKGAFDLLRAMALLKAQVPDAQLVMAGDGELEHARTLCRQLGIEAAVTLTGWIDGAAKCAALAACDVMVLPSYFEGLPIGILEAMAAGATVLASPVGGVPDLIRDGGNGLLVAPGDVPGLARAMLRLCQQEGLADSLAAQAFEDVRAHDTARVTQALAAVYRRAVATQGE